MSGDILVSEAAEPPKGREEAMGDLVLGTRSGAELAARLAAARDGIPHLLFRDDAGLQSIVTLDVGRRLTTGRGDDCDIAMPWD